MTLRHFGGPIQPRKAVEQVVGPIGADRRPREEDENELNAALLDERDSDRPRVQARGDVRGAPQDTVDELDEAEDAERMRWNDYFKSYFQYRREGSSRTRAMERAAEAIGRRWNERTGFEPDDHAPGAAPVESLDTGEPSFDEPQETLDVDVQARSEGLARGDQLLGSGPRDDGQGISGEPLPGVDSQGLSNAQRAPEPELAPRDALALARVQARVEAAQEEAAQARAGVEARPSRASREALKGANYRVSVEANRLERLNSEIAAQARADRAEAARAEVRAERGSNAEWYAARAAQQAPDGRAEAPTGPDGRQELGQPQFTGDAAAAANREREQEVARQVALRRYQRGEDLSPTSRRAVREAIGITNDEGARLGLSDFSPDSADARRQDGSLAAGIAGINAQRQAANEAAEAQYEIDKTKYESDLAAYQAAIADYEAQYEAKYSADLTPAERRAQDDAVRVEDRFAQTKLIADHNAAQKVARADFDDAVNEENLNLDLAALPTDAARAAAINTARQQEYQRKLDAFNAAQKVARADFDAAVDEENLELDLEALPTDAAKADAINTANQERYDRALAEYNAAMNAAQPDDRQARASFDAAVAKEGLELDLEALPTDAAKADAINTANQERYDRALAEYNAAQNAAQPNDRQARASFDAAVAKEGLELDLEALPTDAARADAINMANQERYDRALAAYNAAMNAARSERSELFRAWRSKLPDGQQPAGAASTQKLDIADLDQELRERERHPKATMDPPAKSDLPHFGVQAQVQDARSGQFDHPTIDTSQETVQAMAREYQEDAVAARAEAEKRRADEAARLEALGLELTAAYQNPRFLAEEEARIRGMSMRELDPKRMPQIERQWRLGTAPSVYGGTAAAKAAYLERERQELIEKQVSDLRSGRALNPSGLTKVGDTVHEGLTLGGVDTRTYNPAAGIDAFKEAQAGAKVVHEYGDPVYGPFEDTQEAGPSPDNPLSADRAHFAAQPTLRSTAAHTTLSVAVPGYSAGQHYRRTGDIAWGDLAIDAASFIPAVGLVGRAGRMRRGLGSYGALGREAIVTPRSLYKTIRHPVKTARRFTDSVIHGGKVVADTHTIPHSALIKTHGSRHIPGTELGVDPSLLSPGKYTIRPDEQAVLQARASVDAATMMAARGETGVARLPTGEVLEIDPVPLGQTTRGALVHATPFSSMFSKELRVDPAYGPLHSAPTGAPKFASESALGLSGPFPGYGVILDKDVIDQTVSSGATYQRNFEVERMTRVDDVLPRAQQYLQAHSVPDIGSEAYTVAVVGGKLSPRQIAELKVRGIVKAANDLTPWGLRSKGYRIRDDVLDPDDLARRGRGADDALSRQADEGADARRRRADDALSRQADEGADARRRRADELADDAGSSGLQLRALTRSTTDVEARRQQELLDQRRGATFDEPARRDTPVLEDPERVRPVLEDPERVRPVLEDPERVRPVLEDPERVRPVLEDPERVRPVLEDPERVRPVSEDPERVRPILEDPERVRPVLEDPERVRPVLEDPERVRPVLEDPERVRPVSEDPERVRPILEDPERVRPVLEDPERVRPILEDPERVRPVLEDPERVRPILEDPERVRPILEDPERVRPILEDPERVRPILEDPERVRPILEDPERVRPVLEDPERVRPILEDPERVRPVLEDPERVRPILEDPERVRPVLEDPGRVRPPRTDLPADDRSPDGPQATPRPPGAYPRAIEHQEQVEYRYNPETGEFNARIVASREPVVTGWDRTPPEREERAVGTWDVTPDADGVTASNGQRVTVPEGIKAQLRQEAEATGEPASTTATLRYHHDLDTRETSSQARRYDTRSLAERVEALRNRSQTGGGELGPRYQRLLARMMQAKKQRPARSSQNRRASRTRKEKLVGFKLPEIVIVQEPAITRRVGGL